MSVTDQPKGNWKMVWGVVRPDGSVHEGLFGEDPVIVWGMFVHWCTKREADALKSKGYSCEPVWLYTEPAGEAKPDFVTRNQVEALKKQLLESIDQSLCYLDTVARIEEEFSFLLEVRNETPE